MAEKVTVRILAGAVKDHFIGCTRFSSLAPSSSSSFVFSSFALYLSILYHHGISTSGGKDEFSMSY